MWTQPEVVSTSGKGASVCVGLEVVKLNELLANYSTVLDPTIVANQLGAEGLPRS